MKYSRQPTLSPSEYGISASLFIIDDKKSSIIDLLFLFSREFEIIFLLKKKSLS